MRIPPGMGKLTPTWKHHLEINQHTLTSLLVEWSLESKLQHPFWLSGEQEVMRKQVGQHSRRGMERKR